MKENMPTVSVITVNYNGKKFLDDCFNSLFGLDFPEEKLEVLMVDNGSSDGSVAYVKKNFPRVKVLRNDINNYARANNLGIRKSKGEFVALINNDVKVDKAWLKSLIQLARKSPSAGALGSKILFMDGTVQSVGHEEHPNFYWSDIGFGKKDCDDYMIPREVASICGCSVLYRRECLKDVGHLDEDFNMYVEDVDMAVRCRKKGWKLLICPQSLIRHKLHSSIGTQDKAGYWQERNRLLLIAKHWPEKLAEALFGKGYFTVNNDHVYENVRDISEVVPYVINKLIKEHGYEKAVKIGPELFQAVHKIYNFEKEHLLDDVRGKHILYQAKECELYERSQEVARKDQQLAALKQEKDLELALLKKEKEERISSLEQERDRQAAMIHQQTETQLAALSQQKEAELAAAKSAQEERVSVILKDKEEQIALLERRREEEFAALKADKEELLSQLRQQREAELAALKSEKDEQIARLQEQAQGDLTALKTETASQLAVLRQQREAELTALKSEKDEQIARLQEQAQGDLTALKTETASQLAVLRQQREAELAALKSEKDEQIARLQERAQEELTVLKTEMASQLAVLRQQREAELAALRSEKDEQIARLQQQTQRELATLKAEKQEQLSALREQRDEELAAFTADRDAQITALLQQQEEDLSRIQEEKEKEFSALRQQRDEELAALKAHHQEERNAFEENRTRELESLKEDIRRRVAALMAEAEKKEQVIKEVKAEGAASLDVLRRQKDEELVALNHQKDLDMSGLRQEQASQMAELAQRHEEALSALQYAKDAEINSYRVRWQKTKDELDGIYCSTGYRYLLKPLWDLLWPIKQKVAGARAGLRNFLALFRVEYVKTVIFPKFPRMLSRLKQIGDGVRAGSGWSGVYLNHIKHKTFPPKPTRLTLMLNRTCNLKCAFCDVASSDRSPVLSTENAFCIVDQVAKLGVTEMVLTGGEPFLHAGLFEIAQYAKARRITVVVTTNGLLVEKHLNAIITSGIDCVSVSVDGKEATHDLLRNRPGAYKEALKAIQLLRENRVNASVNFVVTNKNVRELEEVYDFFSRQGIKVSFLPVINKPELFPSAKEEREVFTAFIRKLLNRNLISRHDYKYLQVSMSNYFGQKNTRVRCLGLSNELGIDTDGTISPCCVWENRRDELNHLGNALTANLEDLWYSPRFQEVRSSIFKDGCQKCFNPSIIDLPRLTGIDFLIAKSNGKKQFTLAPATELDAPPGKPGHVHMRLTSRCNLACRHCDIWKIKKNTGREISLQDWKSCADKLHKWLGNFRLDLAGGEILLYPDCISVIQHCAAKGIRVNLTTNSTLIDGPMAEKIAGSGLYCINLSLDGLKDTHCYTRNNANVFNKVRQAVQNLLKHRKSEQPYISLTTVITKYNLKELPDIVKLTQEWGINNIGFQALDQNFGARYHGGWFKDNEFWPTEYAEVANAIDGLIAMKRSGLRIDNSIEQLNAFKNYYKDPNKEIQNQCFTGFNNFIVNEFGEALLCWNMPPVGSLLKDDPEKIWASRAASQGRCQIAKCKRTCRILNCNYA